MITPPATISVAPRRIQISSAPKRTAVVCGKGDLHSLLNRLSLRLSPSPSERVARRQSFVWQRPTVSVSWVSPQHCPCHPWLLPLPIEPSGQPRSALSLQSTSSALPSYLCRSRRRLLEQRTRPESASSTAHVLFLKAAPHCRCSSFEAPSSLVIVTGLCNPEWYLEQRNKT